MKSKFFRQIISGLLFLHLPLLLPAQQDDAGLWGSINLEKKLTKKWSLHFSEELRLNENFTELGTAYSELTGEYRINKLFSVSGGYRFILKRQVDDSYSIRHRYLVNLNIKNKIGLFTANARIRYQSQYSEVESSEDGQVPSNYLRPKLTVKYSTGKRYTPYVTGEIFIHLNRADGILMDAFRIGAGMEYEFSKKSTVEVGYLVDREVQIADPLTSYVITIGWNYILK